MHKIKQATSGLTDLAQSIAVPHDHKPTRLPSFPNLERTAVVPGLITTSIQIAGGASSDLLLVRSPVYPMWATTPSTLGADTIACRYYRTGDGATGNYVADGDVAFFPNNYFSGASYNQIGTSPTILNYPLGVTDDGRYYVKTCSTGLSMVQFQVTTGPAAGSAYTFTLQVENYDGAESSFFTFDVTLPVGATSCAATLSSNNVGPWWRPVSLTLKSHTGANLPGLLLSFYAGICGAGTLTIPTAGSLSAFLPISSPPEFTTQPVPYSGTRANATAALISNTTAVLDKEGIIRAARLPRTRVGSTWWQGVVSVTDSTLYSEPINSANPADRYFGPAEKGLYTFTLPDAASERFRDYTAPSGLNQPARMMLEGFDYVHLITVSDRGGNSSAFAVTLDTHLEFRSSSMFYPLGFSTTSLEAYHVAQMALAKQGVFYENPLHLGMIAGLVRSAVTRFAPIAMPYIRSAATSAGNYLINEAVKRVNTKMAQAGFTSPPPAQQRQRPKKPRQKPQKKGKKVVVKRK